jgi:hypothetical protein
VELPGAGGWRSRWGQALVSCGYVVLLAASIKLGPGQAGTVLLGLFAAVGFFAWGATYRRVRAIADIATSRIGTAAQGYVELVGRASAKPDDLIRSPLGGVSCVWYRFRRYSRDNGDRDWQLIDSGVSSRTFEITDASGACRVDPDDAEVVAADVRTTCQGDQKWVEELLFGGSMVYVLGEYTTVGGAHAALSVAEDVRALLATWKQDPAALRRRFDLDVNAEIDLQQWEAVRRAATRQVEQTHREVRNVADSHIVRAPRDGRVFLISPLSPRKLRRRYLWWSAFHLVMAALGVGLLLRH